jgi:hypothetical protein
MSKAVESIKSIASIIIKVGTAAGVLIGVWTWTKSQQEISWMTFFVVLFVFVIIFLISNHFIIEPIKKKSLAIEKKINDDKIAIEKKFNDSNMAIQKRMDDNFEWIKKNMQNIFDILRELHDAVREIQVRVGGEFVHTLSPKAIDGWAISGSPLKLSEAGKNLLKKSTIDEIVSENAEKLILKIEELKLTTAYDVQDKSFSVLAEFVLKTPELEKRIKDFVFNNPVVEDRHIGFRDVIYVGSLQLRDEYLKRHSEFNV